MKKRYMIAVAALVLAVVGVTIAQQHTIPKTDLPQPQRPLAPQPSPGVPTTPPQPDLPRHERTAPTHDPLVAAPTHRQQAAEAKPENLTIEQLIDAVDGFREQKAELEKKEKAYLKVLHRKADKLNERIDGLGEDGQPKFVPQQSVPGPSCGPGPSLPPGVIPSSSTPHGWK